MRRNRSPLRCVRWLPLVAAVLGVSCSGRGLHPVQGKVLHNGQPATGAIVVFHPKSSDDLNTMRPSGVVDETGTYTLTTVNPGDGAAADEYAVTVVWPEEAKPTKPTSTEPPPLPPDRLKGKYADRKKTPFTAQVKQGSNEIPPFVVE